MPPYRQLRILLRAGRFRSPGLMAAPMLVVVVVALSYPELGAVTIALLGLATAVLTSAGIAALLPAYSMLRDVSVLVARLEKQRFVLEQLALQDPLTGINNRRGGERLLTRAGKLRAAESSPLSVAVVDVDNLRDLNAVGGHARGDAGLRRIAEELAAVLRADDWVARWGGDEFLVVCHCPATEMVAIMDRVRATLASNRGESLNDTPKVSVGVAQLHEDESLDACIARADEALFAAKRQGRDNVLAALWA